jgi:hypothetical protein
MKSMRIPYLPSLDGIDIAQAAPLMETAAARHSIDAINWQEFPYKPIAAVDAARSSNMLYLHYFVRGLSLRAMAAQDGQYVHPDSCVEFFMRAAHSMRYTNFEFNCIGTCLAARGDNRHDRMPFTAEEYAMIKRHSTINHEAFAEKHGIYQWELTAAIPFELMGMEAARLPEKFYGNFYKCADQTSHPHYVTWNPIPLPSPDYHCPMHFGEIYF